MYTLINAVYFFFFKMIMSISYMINVNLACF